MLSSLHIRNLALVESLDIEFGPGLNVVTGETGAGKSVILGAIKLLLGGRADKSLIRSGSKVAELSAILELGQCSYLKGLSEEILAQAGIIADENGQVILRRVISNSSNKNYINSTPTSLASMKALGSCFIDVYAPGEQQGLADNSKQRLLLDRYAGLQKEVDKVAIDYKALNKLCTEKDNFHQDIPDRGELEILKYQLKEIKDAKLQKDEDVTVQKAYNQCAGSRELMDAAMDIQNGLNGEGNSSAMNTLQNCTRQLLTMNSIDGEGTKNFIQRIEAAMEELFELSSDLDNYTSRLNLDPENLAFLEERMHIIQQMKRKFGPELTDVLAYTKKISDKISKAEQHEERYEKLLKSIEKAQSTFDKSCAILSKKRRAVTGKISSSISDQLKDLGFKSSEFSVELSPTSASSCGSDHVEFCFAPNAGEGSKPLKDIGSSGEVSRVMLAIKTVLAKIDRVPVLIFDEIDANIGGIVATQVARKLIELGKHHQIFCITHMPQVAAGGSIHFRVEKNMRDGRTYTEMILLENEDRAEEIARMLGGTEISSVVLSHAQELIASAK